MTEKPLPWGSTRNCSGSNEMPTMTTKPISGANPFHPLLVGVSVKMSSAGHARRATVHSASLRKDGWAP